MAPSGHRYPDSSSAPFRAPTHSIFVQVGDATTAMWSPFGCLSVDLTDRFWGSLIVSVARGQADRITSGRGRPTLVLHSHARNSSSVLPASARTVQRRSRVSEVNPPTSSIAITSNADCAFAQRIHKHFSC